MYTHTHIKTLCENNNQSQYSAAVYLFNAIREHIITSTNETATTHNDPVQSTSTIQLTKAGESQLRYLGGRCVAKIKYSTVARVRRHMYVKQKLYLEDKRKLLLIGHLIRSERELLVTTKYISSMHVTQHKQFKSRALINISDATFMFFKCLHDAISKLQGNGAFFKHGCNVLNVVETAVLKDYDLKKSFKKCFPEGEEADGINYLYDDCVHRYLLVNNNQYRKSMVHQFVGQAAVCEKGKT